MGEDKRLILQTWFHILGELFNPISVVPYPRIIMFKKKSIPALCSHGSSALV
jgi:hypothetical protein